jgi:hypothetical protein
MTNDELRQAVFSLPACLLFTHRCRTFSLTCGIAALFANASRRMFHIGVPFPARQVFRWV